MKRYTIQYLSLFIFLLSGNTALAQQGVCINCPDANPIPAADAILDVQSNAKGMLIPRLSARPSSPTTGLMIYNTFTKNLEFYDGTEWRRTGLWSIASGETKALEHVDDTKLFGIDLIMGFDDLRFKATPAAPDNHLYINTDGKIGIGSNVPGSRLSFANVVEPKISLWDGGDHDYGFGVSSLQLNYHVGGTTADHVFYANGDNGDGTELMRIKGNGNLNVQGNITLADDRDILGADLIQGFDDLRFRASASASDNHLYINTIGNIGIGSNVPGSRLSFANVVEPKISLWDGGDHDYGFGVSSLQLNYHVGGTTADHVFYANGDNGDGTELMRIRGDGNVAIGTSTNIKEKFNVEGNTYTNGIVYSEQGFIMPVLHNGSTAWRAIIPADPTDRDAYFSAATYAAPSDRRFKKNIQPLNSAIQKVQQLAGVSYQWNEKAKEYFTKDIEKTVVAGPNATPEENQKAINKEKERFKKTLDHKEIGFIAQEVEEILPELIETKKDGYKGIKYGQVTALLVEAIKEQQTIIDQQRQQLAQQAAMINNFEARLSVLENKPKEDKQTNKQSSTVMEER